MVDETTRTKELRIQKSGLCCTTKLINAAPIQCYRIAIFAFKNHKDRDCSQQLAYNCQCLLANGVERCNGTFFKGKFYHLSKI